MKCISLLVVSFLLSSSVLSASNDWSNKIHIASIESHSNTYETVVPHRSGETWVYPDEPLVWHSGNGCKTGAVVIDKNDTTLLSMAMAAMAANQNVIFYVDRENTQGDFYCVLRSLQVLSN